MIDTFDLKAVLGEAGCFASMALTALNLPLAPQPRPPSPTFETESVEAAPGQVGPHTAMESRVSEGQ